MKEKKYTNKTYIIYSIVIIAFICLSIFVGMKHEPRADEAQAWLIARDSSIKELFAYYLHVDGHPGL